MYYLFRYIENITNKPITYFIEFFLKNIAAFSILNILLYFIELPIWDRFHMYFGRVSVGYPTIDSLLFVMAYAILLFNKKIFLNRIIILILFIFIPLNILLSSSGTGIATFTSIILLYFIKTLKKINFLFTIRMATITIICFAIVYYSITWIEKNHPILYKQFEWSINNKINGLIGNEEEVDKDTMNTRSEQFYDAYNKFVTNDFYRIFGIGFSRIALDVKEFKFKSNSNNYISIENQYGNILVSMGYIGIILFSLFIISPIIYALKKSRDIFFETVALYVIFILGCFTNPLLSNYATSSLISLHNVKIKTSWTSQDR